MVNSSNASAITDLSTCQDLILIDAVYNDPNNDLCHALIEAENYHALKLLERIYAGKIDCIYIDPPYNTGAMSWKYNNNYTNSNEKNKHSAWLSMMRERLVIAKNILKPDSSVLLITIDDHEVHALSLLIEELFPESHVQTIIDVVNPSGKNGIGFSIVHEYIIAVMIGTMRPSKASNDMLHSKDGDYNAGKALAWEPLIRRGSKYSPSNKPGLFYPIIVDRETERIIGVGDGSHNVLDSSRCNDGCFMAWPKRKDGTYSVWRVSPQKLLELAKDGYAYVTGYDDTRDTYTFRYLMRGDIDRINNGEVIVKKDGRRGEVVAVQQKDRMKTPKTVWNLDRHNAGIYGSALLSSIIGRRNFPFPKSIYSVLDTLRFFIGDKPDALVVDFFAGSGTTLHAVNLLNSIDGGRRQCFLITNNEVSASEARSMIDRGLRPGDDEWEALGIARYITWPRTVCSIKGCDITGKPLKGVYVDGNIPMSDGFKANAKFYRLASDNG